MDFRTIVDIPKGTFSIEPCEEMLFVGSCFADNIGRCFVENKFRAVVNPYGAMYNPVSVWHTVARTTAAPRVVFITLGTNHVYMLKETGEIVDNCQKRPQRLFREALLSVGECAEYLQRSVDELQQRNPNVRVVFTVSPIRYSKYGYHESQLSKSVLLLAADNVVKQRAGVCEYFPAYEIVNDELRDYRFYAQDMIHPSNQAVEYIWERLSATYFSEATKQFMTEWIPIKKALEHRPFDPDGNEYKEFMRKTMLKVDEMSQKYPNFAL